MQDKIFIVLIGQKNEFDFGYGAVTERLLLWQYASQHRLLILPCARRIEFVLRWLHAARDGVRNRVEIGGFHHLEHTCMLQINELALRLALICRYGLNTRKRREACVFLLAQQLFEAMAHQAKRTAGRLLLRFESRMHKGRGGLVVLALGRFEMTQIGVEDKNVRRRARLVAMTLHTSGQLDQRTHRRWFGNRPACVPIAAHFANRRREYNEYMIGFRMCIDRLANFRQRVDGLRLATVERGIQPILDGRAQQQRKARVIHTQMNAVILGRAEPE